MFFFVSVLVGGLFAWIAVQIGFYATWILFFHLVLAAYIAIFLTPIIIPNISAAATTDYGTALILASVAIATLFIAYGICFACLTGHLRVEFPKIFDSVIAGLLGFQAGFLVWSFVILVFCLTPLAKSDYCRTHGFDVNSQQSNISFVCWWCDRFHSLVSIPGSQKTSDQIVRTLWAKMATPKAKTHDADAGEEAGNPGTPPPPPPGNTPGNTPASTAAPDAGPTPAKTNGDSKGSPGSKDEHPAERHSAPR